MFFSFFSSPCQGECTGVFLQNPLPTCEDVNSDDERMVICEEEGDDDVMGECFKRNCCQIMGSFRILYPQNIQLPKMSSWSDIEKNMKFLSYLDLNVQHLFRVRFRSLLSHMGKYTAQQRQEHAETIMLIIKQYRIRNIQRECIFISTIIQASASAEAD